LVPFFFPASTPPLRFFSPLWTTEWTWILEPMLIPLFFRLFALVLHVFHWRAFLTPPPATTDCSFLLRALVQSKARTQVCVFLFSPAYHTYPLLHSQVNSLFFALIEIQTCFASVPPASAPRQPPPPFQQGTSRTSRSPGPKHICA